METVLGIFCKQPISGKVKTRLAADLGDEFAAALYEAFLRDVVERFRTTADDRILCYAPNEALARDYFDHLSSGDYRLLPQVEGDLGGRLAAFFNRALEGGPRKVVVIGSDSPTLTTARIREVCDELEQYDSVLGMTPDGGYHLIGLRRITDGLFDRIDWSTSSVFDQQQQRLDEAGFSLRRLSSIHDIDTIDDLQRLRRDPALELCPQTSRVLEQLDAS